MKELKATDIREWVDDNCNIWALDSNSDVTELITEFYNQACNLYDPNTSNDGWRDKHIDKIIYSLFHDVSRHLPSMMKKTKKHIRRIQDEVGMLKSDAPQYHLPAPLKGDG